MDHTRGGPSQIWLVFLLVLVLYTVGMLWLEASTSQEYVRLYFTDIGMAHREGRFAAADGDIGYGFNTTLSAFLLASAGVLLIFGGSAACMEDRDRKLLFILQGIILIYLGADDRFMLHERIGAAVGVYSTAILALAALANGLVYLRFFRFSALDHRAVILLVLAVGLTGAMMCFDLLIPKQLPLRLSGEDLLKVWASWFFFRFAWEAVRFRLVSQPAGQPAFAVPEKLLAMVPGRLRRLLVTRFA